MQVIKTLPLSEESQEVILQITDGQYLVNAFSHPNFYKIGDFVRGPLVSLEEEKIVRTHESLKIEKGNDSCFSYDIVGCVADLSDALLEVGGIRIQLSLALPKDILLGDKIHFYTSRLDVM